MSIGDETFKLAADHLAALDYNGPVGLSCDDTKLFSTFRMYWDANEKADFLVGAVGGPMRVIDPDHMKRIMADPDVIKGTKVSFFSHSKDSTSKCTTRSVFGVCLFLFLELRLLFSPLFP